MIIYIVIRETKKTSRHSFPDIHLSEQQKIMTTHTHQQTDIKKEKKRKEHEWMNEKKKMNE